MIETQKEAIKVKYEIPIWNYFIKNPWKGQYIQLTYCTMGRTILTACLALA